MIRQILVFIITQTLLLGCPLPSLFVTEFLLIFIPLTAGRVWIGIYTLPSHVYIHRNLILHGL